jgi:hypothetical protein
MDPIMIDDSASDSDIPPSTTSARTKGKEKAKGKGTKRKRDRDSPEDDSEIEVINDITEGSERNRKRSRASGDGGTRPSVTLMKSQVQLGEVIVIDD